MKKIVEEILDIRANLGNVAAEGLIRTMAQSPELFARIMSESGASLNEQDRFQIVSWIVAFRAPKDPKSSDTAPGTEVTPGTIRDKILTYLKDHPKSAAVAIKEAIGAVSGGGFAAALKVGVDKGQIICHEPNPPETVVKTYSLDLPPIGEGLTHADKGKR